jgi:hypothetical protein
MHSVQPIGPYANVTQKCATNASGGLYAVSADVRTVLAWARLAATLMLRLQRGITDGRRVASFRTALIACLAFRALTLVGSVFNGRALKAGWRPSLFKGRWQRPFSRPRHCQSPTYLPTDAMGKGWQYCKMKNDRTTTRQTTRGPAISHG